MSDNSNNKANNLSYFVYHATHPLFNRNNTKAAQFMITGFSVLNLKYKSQKNSDRQKQKPYHYTYNNLIIKCIFNKNLININPALFS